MPHLRRLLPYLRGHRSSLLKGLSCLLLTTALSLASPWILRYAVDDMTVKVTQQKLALYAALIVGFVLLEGVFRYLMRRILIGASREIEYELRNDLFAHLTRLSLRYYQSHRIGDVMSRAVNDMSAVRMVLGPGIMYTASTVATALGAIALMLPISPWLLASALLPLLLVSFLMRRYGKRIHDHFERVQEQLSSLSALVQENLAGARVVRAYAQEQSELDRFEAANGEYLRRNRELIRTFGALYPGIQLFMGVGAVLVLWLGGRMVVRGAISLGEFVAFSAYLAMLHWPMIALGWVINLFERGEASMGRIAAILEEVPEIQDGDGRAAREIKGDVEFRSLSFFHDGHAVLQDVSLAVPAGTTVAIVGPTGSGKSTLVSLLPRLYDPPPGSVFVDGRDVRELPLATLRSAIGFVPQESFLFSDTVEENVAFGLEAKRVDGGSGPGPRVEWAAGIAQLAKDVEDFPAGYETFVGERGITLSGGQKQRAALARALAVDPRILVLDDALSSVDTDTEEAILNGLDDVRRARTTLLVSHRVSTVKTADVIVVLREGRIVERGTHESLVAHGGYYTELYTRQLLEEAVEAEA